MSWLAWRWKSGKTDVGAQGVKADNASSRGRLAEKLDPGVESNKEEVCEWFARWTPVVYKAFSGRIKKLAAPEDE